MLKRKFFYWLTISNFLYIIVLLILAGVSIAMLTGQNGILTQVQKAKEETENAQANEANILSSYEDYLSQYANGGYVESKGVNAPVLKDGMELVTYNEETKNWDTNNSSSAYNYVDGEKTGENNSSEWANAKVTIDGVDSYFVWIPRYAYKINYNEPGNISAGGTIDVKFLIGTSDNYYDDEGNLQTAKRATTGHEDTTSDYYVHPAFTSNVDLGGWSNELTGFWVGKYESSLVEKETKKNIVTTKDGDTAGNILLSDNTDKAMAVQPGMSSWRYCTIGNMYTNAKAYSEKLNSHMLKNSEWGAVAYLTESKYGRNGTEVTINDNSSYITADEGISINPDQSSTGNVTGIYDLSGGAWEYVAAYYKESSSLPNGSSFADGSSDEYSTVYTETSASSSYKLGDATYETSGWHQDYAYFVDSDSPFFGRGGYYSDNSNAGLFNFGSGYYGKSSSAASFHICLAVK